MFNIKKAFFCLTSVICASLTIAAQDGSRSYSFLNIPSSAKIYGLGGVNISTVDGGIESIEQNPALLGPEYEKSIGVGYMRYFGDSNFGSVSFGNGIRDHSAWAVGVRYLGYGSIQKTDIEGTVLGDFSPIDMVMSVAYSRDINSKMRGGIALKGIYSSYDEYNAFALAVDLGINYYDPERDLSLSAVVVNLGGQLKRFDNVYERLPVDLRLGWTQSFPSFPVRFSVTAWNLTKWNVPYTEILSQEGSSGYRMKSGFAKNLFRHLVFSADIIPSEHFYLSIGYNYKIRTDMAAAYRNLFSGFSLGCGINLSQWNVGLAYAQPHRGGNTFMVNISTSINQFLK